MSGSGGGGGRTPTDEELNCATVEFRTTLASVQTNALAKLKIGMRLDVVVRDGKVVAVFPDTSNLVGSINWSKNSDLIACMDEGFEYVATVRSINDGLVNVQVRAA